MIEDNKKMSRNKKQKYTIDDVMSSLTSLNKRMDNMESRMDDVKSSLNKRMDNMESRMDDVKSSLRSLNKRMDNMESRMDNMEARINRIKKSKSVLIIPPRRSHVYPLGNSMDVSDIEEVPNSAYK